MPPPPQPPKGRTECDPQSEQAARALLERMSPAEKLGCLDGDTPFWSGMAEIATRDASHRHPWPAGVVPRLGIGGLHFVDGPRGVVLEGGATTFPVPIARGASWDPELEERIGVAIGLEARSFGANWVGAVCVNLLRHPGWGRAQETYGEDPVHVGAMGAALTRGLQRHTIACVKHFALNSIDGCRFLVDVQASPRVLHELYLPHFRDCVDAGAGSVMSAYNRVNGEWCGQHPLLLQGLLKDRWGFRGFVVTDFIFGLRDGPRALQAGLDLEMPFPMILAGSLGPAAGHALSTALQARIDDAVLRQLRVQLAVPAGRYPVTLRRCADHLALAREAATKAIVLLRNEGPLLPLAATGSLAVIGRLAALPNLGDRGSSDTRPAPGSVVTPLAGLRAAAPAMAVRYEEGRNLAAAAALAAASEAAVVVVGLDWLNEGEHIHPGDIAPVLEQVPPPAALVRWLGWRRLMPLWRQLTRLIAALARQGSARPGSHFASGDRTCLGLPAAQLRLIRAVAAANPRTVVVLMGGGAILCEEWRQLVPALLLLWYPGEQGGAALADVIFGRVSPSGRLPFALPTSEAHLPPFDPRARRLTYDLWHGYRRLRRQGHAAAYPFGWGLSYAAFTHEGLVARLVPQEPVPQAQPLEQQVLNERAPQAQGPDLQVLAVSLVVRNTAAVPGDEVVQVYVEPPGQRLPRAARQLVGFQRLSLAAGQALPLSLRIPLRRLAYFDEARDTFVLEAGCHRVLVAPHAEAAGLAVELTLREQVLDG